MQIRHLITTVLTAALVLAPTTAFAQEGGEEPPAEESTSTTLEELGDVLGDIIDTFFLTRDERDAAEDEESTDADASSSDESEDAQSAFEDLVSSLETVVSDLFANVVWTLAEADATATAEDLEDEGANGEAVSTLAQCAPRGSFGALLEGVDNHGEYVTAAAHGETVQLNVPTIETTEPAEGTEGQTSYEVVPAVAPTDFDLTTTQGAEDLCAALDVMYQARLLELEIAWEEVDVHQDARVLAREQCQLQRLRERNGADVDAKTYCADLREKIKDMHAEARAQAKADREAARAEAKAERDAAKAERDEARAEARAQREAARGRS